MQPLTTPDFSVGTFMPAAFIGHGSPMNALEDNRFTAAWRALGRELPRPRAVLAISAHWVTRGSAVTAMERPPVIHDFGGFPQALFACDYPAPGSPALAREVAALLAPQPVALDATTWGLDHGTWSVLVHVLPAADVPVVQLSIDGTLPAAAHVELGRRLAPLREAGVFILASGNVVHNLRAMDRTQPASGHDWALRFDAAVRRTMTTHPADIAHAAPAERDFALAVPTAEHFVPLLYLAGLADAAGALPEPFAEGATMGSLTMTSYLLGAPRPRPDPLASPAGAAVPDPRVVPPEVANV